MTTSWIWCRLLCPWHSWRRRTMTLAIRSGVELSYIILQDSKKTLSRTLKQKKNTFPRLYNTLLHSKTKKNTFWNSCFILHLILLYFVLFRSLFLQLEGTLSPEALAALRWLGWDTTPPEVATQVVWSKAHRHLRPGPRPVKSQCHLRA